MGMSNLKKYRKLAGLTQKDLGNAAQVKPMCISYYERGLRGVPIERARNIVSAIRARGVECSLDTVFGEFSTEAAT